MNIIIEIRFFRRTPGGKYYHRRVKYLMLFNIDIYFWSSCITIIVHIVQYID